MNYIQHFEVRWSDLDPNFHLRHSVYYDYSATCRLKFLFENGITEEVMRQHMIGPILFREECFFKREIKFGSKVTISLKLRSISADFRKFSFVHEIFSDDEPAATLIVDGAWMNTEKRKVTAPPQIIIDTLQHMPKSDDFVD